MSLSELLRKTIEVTVTNEPLVKFCDFTRRLQVPAYLEIISMEPLSGYAMVATNATTVHLVVDQFLRGMGQTCVEPK